MLDILFYTKKRDFNYVLVSVEAFVEEVAQSMAAKLASRGIDFFSEHDEEMGEFAIDHDYLRAALANILENAMDACGQTGGDNAAKISFTATADAQQVCFRVADTGVGMDQETIAKLFTVFFSTKGRRGTGLGLFVANQVVEQHGGHISVRSQPGKGTIFRIDIPRSPAVEG
jgi:signal transduction histidine kinase